LVTVDLGVKFGPEIHGIDWLFPASLGTIILLFSSMVVEWPLIKSVNLLLGKTTAN
jgi:hypothetical protein